MSVASFQIDQVRPGGTSHGTADVARNDLWLGRQINLVSLASGSHHYLWSFLDAPVGSSWGPSTPPLNPTMQMANFTPDVLGSYRVQLLVDNSVSEIMICAVRYNSLGVLQKRGWCYPAQGEEVNEDNFNGGTRGWNGILDGIFDDILSFLESGGAGIGVEDHGTLLPGGPWATLNFTGNVSLSTLSGVVSVDVLGSNSYTPAVPSNWNPAPTTYDGALDQLANGGVFSCDVSSGSPTATIPPDAKQLVLTGTPEDPTFPTISCPTTYTVLVTNTTRYAAYVEDAAADGTVVMAPFTSLLLTCDTHHLRAVNGWNIFPVSQVVPFSGWQAPLGTNEINIYGADSDPFTTSFSYPSGDGAFLLLLTNATPGVATVYTDNLGSSPAVTLQPNTATPVYCDGMSNFAAIGSGGWLTDIVTVTGDMEVTVPPGYQELLLVAGDDTPTEDFAVSLTYASTDGAFVLLVTNQTGYNATVTNAAFLVSPYFINVPPYTSVEIFCDGMRYFRAVTGGPPVVPLQIQISTAVTIDLPAVDTTYTINTHSIEDGLRPRGMKDVLGAAIHFSGQPTDGLSITVVDTDGAWSAYPFNVTFLDQSAAAVQNPASPGLYGMGSMTVWLANASVTWTWSQSDDTWYVSSFTNGYIPNEVVPLSDDVTSMLSEGSTYYGSVALSNVLQALSVTDEYYVLSSAFGYQPNIQAAWTPFAVFLRNATTFPMTVVDPYSLVWKSPILPGFSAFVYHDGAALYCISQPLTFTGTITCSNIAPATGQFFSLPLPQGVTTMRMRILVRVTTGPDGSGLFTTDCSVTETTVVWVSNESGAVTLVPASSVHLDQFATPYMPVLTYTPADGSTASVNYSVPQQPVSGVILSYEVTLEGETV